MLEVVSIDKVVVEMLSLERVALDDSSVLGYIEVGNCACVLLALCPELQRFGGVEVNLVIAGRYCDGLSVWAKLEVSDPVSRVTAFE
eukprot:scaffold2263_cov272-Pinguiococcus_pyrenoidosus.AAC.2